MLLYYLWSISITKNRRYSEIFCVWFALFLYWKTAAIQNISFYVWYISLAKDRRLADECSRGISQITLQFFLRQNIIMVFDEKVPNYAPSTVIITSVSDLWRIYR